MAVVVVTRWEEEGGPLSREYVLFDVEKFPETRSSRDGDNGVSRRCLS